MGSRAPWRESGHKDEISVAAGKDSNAAEVSASSKAEQEEMAAAATPWAESSGSLLESFVDAAG